MGEPRLGPLTALVGGGYFFVWTLLGVAAFPLGVALAEVEMRQPAVARSVPIVVGVVVLLSGLLQLTRWKARHLACCRDMPGPGRVLPAGAGTAWRHGVRLGVHCVYCCAGLMAILLVAGIMDLRAMAVVTAAITVERLAPGRRARRASDLEAVAIVAGLAVDRGGRPGSPDSHSGGGPAPYTHASKSGFKSWPLAASIARWRSVLVTPLFVAKPASVTKRRPDQNACSPNRRRSTSNTSAPLLEVIGPLASGGVFQSP